MASRWLAVDKTLFITTLTLLAIGMVMVYSASFPASEQHWGHDKHYLLKQSAWAVLGLTLLLACLLIDYRHYRNPLVVGGALAGALGALVLVFLVPAAGGVHRWLYIGGQSMQPSEVAKLVVVLFLAYYLARKEDRINELWSGLLPCAAVVGFIVLLIGMEPDLGTAGLVTAVTGVMLWVAGISWKYLTRFAGATMLLATLQIVNSGYQSRRITAFIDPWGNADDAGFQTVQSLIAVATGGLTGVGLGDGKQKLFYLPHPHTDFIYAVVAEELGFVGALVVLVGFMMILWRGLRAALRAPDRFGFYLGIGLTTLLVIQAAVNMSVVLNLLPITGIPLPLISYGGSSLLVSCVALGVLLNVSQHA